MRLGDTIVAVSSPAGRSPRALVRMSGPHTGSILEVMTGSDLRARTATCAVARLTDALTLPILVCRFGSPRSYTGEESAEIQLTGNPSLVERLTGRLIATPGAAVRAAEPGEFTARAYLNGKLTLDQAEGIAAIIAAQTNDQLDAASRLSAGTTGARYRAWAEEVSTLLALVEAGIDFSDQEDVVPISGQRLAERLAALTEQIREYLGAGAGTEVITATPTIVLAGAPNAGKSTLFNALLGRPRAVVSAIAGTTRDVLRETLDLARDIPGASEVVLCDLAGLDGGLGGVIQRQARDGALRALAEADAVIYCDPAGRFPPLPGIPADRPTIRVRTKADLPAAGPTPTNALPVCAIDRWNLGALRRAIADAACTSRSAGPTSPDALPVCAIDRWNLGALRRAIADAACTSRSAGEAALVPRHRRALATALVGITDAGRLCRERGRLREPELIAGNLRQALNGMGELVGTISPDDILGRVFSTFCVGK